MKSIWQQFRAFLKKYAGLSNFIAVAAALVAGYAVRESYGAQKIYVEVTIIICQCFYVLCIVNAIVNYIIPFVINASRNRSPASRAEIRVPMIIPSSRESKQSEVETGEKSGVRWDGIKRWIKLIVAVIGIIASLISLIIVKGNGTFGGCSVILSILSLFFSILSTIMFKKEQHSHRKYWVFLSFAVFFLISVIFLRAEQTQPIPETKEEQVLSVEPHTTDGTTTVHLVTQHLPSVETEGPYEPKATDKPKMVDIDGNPVEQVYITFSYKLQPNTVPSEDRLVYSGPSTDYYQPASEPDHEMKISKSNRHDCAGIDNGWYLVKYYSTIAGKDRIGYVKRVSSDRSNAIAFSYANRKMIVNMDCSLTDGVENYRDLQVGEEVLYLGTMFADNLVNGVDSPYAYVEYEVYGIRYRGVIPLAALFVDDVAHVTGSDEVIIPAPTSTMENLSTTDSLLSESTTPLDKNENDENLVDISQMDDTIYYFDEAFDEPLEKAVVEEFQSNAHWKPVGSKNEFDLHHPDAEHYSFYTQVVVDGVLSVDFKINADGYKNMTAAEYEELIKKSGHNWRIQVMDQAGYFYKELFISREESLKGGKIFYFDLPYGLYYFNMSIMMHDSIQWKVSIDTALVADTGSREDGEGY